MLKAGWNAHKLDAPGKFLVSAPEHDIPRRARAYLVTDQTVTEISARHAPIRPELDHVSQNAIYAAGHPVTTFDMTSDHHADDSGKETADIPASPEDTLWVALCAAPDEGWGIGELMRFTGMARATLYRHLREHVDHGRAYQVSRGHWRARTAGEPSL